MQYQPECEYLAYDGVALILNLHLTRSSKTGSYLVAGYNLASFVGRILFGFLADSRVGPLTSLCLAMLLMAISILSIWIASSGLLAPLILFLLVNGSAAGALLSLQPPTLAALYGLTEMASTMSMVTMSRAAVSAFQLDFHYISDSPLLG
jgi:MFS family permease